MVDQIKSYDSNDPLVDKVNLLLQESNGYGVDCLDLNTDIITLCRDFYGENALAIQKYSHALKTWDNIPPFIGDLEKRLRNMLPLERIPISGSTKEFRRTKIIGHWATALIDVMSKTKN